MQSKDELIITRVFDAPREAVWKAWTDPESMKEWWGPKGFSSPFCKIDFRVGGKFLSCMKAAIDIEQIKEGQEFWSTGTYREIVPQEKIVCTDSFADEKGNVVPSSHYGMAGFPLEMLLTINFEEHEGKTKLTIRHTGIPAGADQDGANQGWNQSLDKLAECLKRG